MGAASVSQGSRNFSEPHCIPLHGPLVPWSAVDVLPLSRQLASLAAQPTPLETASPFSSPGGARQLSRNPERAAQVLRSHLRHFIEEKQGGEGALRGSQGPRTCSSISTQVSFCPSVDLPGNHPLPSFWSSRTIQKGCGVARDTDPQRGEEGPGSYPLHVLHGVPQRWAHSRACVLSRSVVSASLRPCGL